MSDSIALLRPVFVRSVAKYETIPISASEALGTTIQTSHAALGTSDRWYNLKSILSYATDLYD